MDDLRFQDVAEFLHDDCRNLYPMGTTVAGRDNILARARKALGALKGIRHELRGAWEEGEELIFELEVTYWRSDGETIVRPGMGVFVLEDGRIREQRLFVDARGVWD